MTLTYELDLDILPLDLHTKIQVRMFVRSAVRVVTHTNNVKSITPVADEGRYDVQFRQKLIPIQF